MKPALMEVRDARLYLAEHATFEEYCLRRWAMKRRHAYRLLDAAAVVENVSNWTHDTTPSSEAVTRPLTRLEPEQQREAWRKAA
ncbi:MAG TPA: hypothetical protein VHE78_04695 [Gemmatimonadaceae bacterium]|nr:hypothetical protein [Gemmatimonadaceae bacterium]